MKHNKLKFSTVKQVLHYVKNYKLLLFLSILFATITVALTLYIPIIIGRAIDLLVDGKGTVNFDNLLFLLAEVVVISVAIAIFQWIMKILLIKLSNLEIIL